VRVAGSESVCGQRAAAGVAVPHALMSASSETREPLTNTLTLGLTGPAAREPDPGERARFLLVPGG